MTESTGDQRGVWGRPFRKGKSGNPGGRPAIPLELKQAVRALTQDAIKTLELGVKGKLGGDTATTRLMAAQAILDRGWGKPPQAVEVTGYKDAEPLLPHMTEDEVFERLLAKRAERARNVSPELAAIRARKPGKGERG